MIVSSKHGLTFSLSGVLYIVRKHDIIIVDNSKGELI